MARLSNPNPENGPHVGIVMQLILWILAFFIIIGNVVRFFLRLIFLIPLKTYNVTINKSNELFAAVKKWIQKQITFITKPKLPRGRPKKKINYIEILKNKTKKIRTMLRRVCLLHFSLPKISQK